MGVIREPEQWTDDMIQNSEGRVLDKLVQSPHVVEFVGNLVSLCKWRRLKEMMDLHDKLQPGSGAEFKDISAFAAGYLLGMNALPGYLSTLLEAAAAPENRQTDNYGEEE